MKAHDRQCRSGRKVGSPLLIRNAEIFGTGLIQDLRISEGVIQQMGRLEPLTDVQSTEGGQQEQQIDAAGACLLPGLHDHHIHLAALAVSLDSLPCGPPEVNNADELAAQLKKAEKESAQQAGAEQAVSKLSVSKLSVSKPSASRLSVSKLSASKLSASKEGWLRGIGYHESVAGEIDRHWLDAQLPTRPARIQHRSGRLWVLNSAGLDRLQDAIGQANLTASERRKLISKDGRLFDVDDLLGKVLGSFTPNSFAQNSFTKKIEAASRLLASLGVTAINDMTPTNNERTWRWFDELQQSGALLQKVALSGSESLSRLVDEGFDQEHSTERRLTVGARKFHLHDHALPELETFIADIKKAHEAGRGIAVHCVTHLSLVFTLSALASARPLSISAPLSAPLSLDGGPSIDRIEHASVVKPSIMQLLTEINPGIVTQPNFVAERGDAYLQDVPAADLDDLYRLTSLKAVGLAVAFGTDAPFGHADPWAAMRAAIERRTASGKPMTAAEATDPETAVAGFLGSLKDPFTPRQITTGMAADLCLLDKPWREAREQLDAARVTMTIRDGEVIYRR